MGSSNSVGARTVLKQMKSVTGFLVENGFADRYNAATLVKRNGYESIQHARSGLISSAFRDQPYRELYAEQLAAESFNILMLDGALIQMAYQFTSRNLKKHRLAFLPSPDLLEYQNNPEVYAEEVLYAEVVQRGTVPVPLRFDYDSDPAVFQEVDHPICHLTIGQYSNCRIAATAPLTPFAYMSFILRNFYNTATRKISDSLPDSNKRFPKTIFLAEQNLIHIGVPMNE